MIFSTRLVQAAVLQFFTVKTSLQGAKSMPEDQPFGKASVPNRFRTITAWANFLLQKPGGGGGGHLLRTGAKKSGAKKINNKSAAYIR
jgi:hypothetical protein